MGLGDHRDGPRTPPATFHPLIKSAWKHCLPILHVCPRHATLTLHLVATGTGSLCLCLLSEAAVRATPRALRASVGRSVRKGSLLAAWGMLSRV